MARDKHYIGLKEIPKPYFSKGLNKGWVEMPMKAELEGNEHMAKQPSKLEKELNGLEAAGFFYDESKIIFPENKVNQFPLHKGMKFVNRKDDAIYYEVFEPGINQIVVKKYAMDGMFRMERFTRSLLQKGFEQGNFLIATIKRSEFGWSLVDKQTMREYLNSK